MHPKTIVRPVIIGHIELFRRAAAGDEVVLSKKNTVLNSSMDILAKAVAGQMTVNGMYLAFDNDSPPFADITPLVDRTAAFYHDLGAGETKGFCRVPTISTPVFSNTAVDYNHNRVTFTAVSDGVTAISGSSNDLTDGTSQFYGAGLAYLSPDDDPVSDVLFAAVTFADLGGPTHYEKIAGAQFGVRWTLTFTVA